MHDQACSLQACAADEPTKHPAQLQVRQSDWGPNHVQRGLPAPWAVPVEGVGVRAFWPPTEMLAPLSLSEVSRVAM